MTAAQKLYLKALTLPVEARADLTDRLIASLGQGIEPEIERAQINEVKRRIAEVESGAVKLVAGSKAMARVAAEIRKYASRKKSA